MQADPSTMDSSDEEGWQAVDFVNEKNEEKVIFRTIGDETTQHDARYTNALPSDSMNK
jgi:hypothetical protein